MADTSRPDLFDNQPESSGTSNDDFEKLDAPGSGFDGGDAEGINNLTESGAYDYDNERNQEAEISTTTELGGENEAEDRYTGVSEASTLLSQEPLVSLGDDDPFQIQQLGTASSELSPQPLIDFGNSTASALEPDILASFASATVPDTKSEEPFSETSIDSGTPFSKFEDNKSQKEIPNDVSDLSTEKANEGGLLKGVDPRVKDLIYWRDVRTTGVVFGSMMVVLLSLAVFSFMSVVAYLSLACLSVTFTFVVYKKVMAAVQKSGDAHPFKSLLDMDIELKEDKLKSVIEQVLKNVNSTASEVRRLFLVEDFVDSIKFGLLLWVFTYIGAWFNGMTLIILGVILTFTLPKVYETYQVQIDNYVGLAKAQIDNVLATVQSKVPFLKKKEKPQ